MDVQPAPNAAPAAAGPEVSRPSAPPDDGPSFREILSALNPLQYVPVVGTIYRAITGDTIPEAVRVVGSFVFSGLTGGPFGMILNAAAVIAEKITGIDPEVIGRDVLAWMGVGTATQPEGAAGRTQEVGAPSTARPNLLAEATPPEAMSPEAMSPDAMPPDAMPPDAMPWTGPQRAAYAGETVAYRPAPLRPPSPATHLAAIARYRRSLLT